MDIKVREFKLLSGFPVLFTVVLFGCSLQKNVSCEDFQDDVLKDKMLSFVRKNIEYGHKKYNTKLTYSDLINFNSFKTQKCSNTYRLYINPILEFPNGATPLDSDVIIYIYNNNITKVIRII